MIRSLRPFSVYCPVLDRQRAFHLACLLVRAVPELPGKFRLARFALRPFREVAVRSDAGPVWKLALLPKR
jgi:hypothetical protein